MTHTPGPWYHLNGDLIGAIVRERNSIIAELNIESGPQGTKPSANEREANARLIAAAPELLEALEYYVSLCGDTAHTVSDEAAREMFTRGSAAIAKATGK